jgi:DNA-directed RNA polymerase specialized sigma24 family protein
VEAVVSAPETSAFSQSVSAAFFVFSALTPLLRPGPTGGEAMNDLAALFDEATLKTIRERARTLKKNSVFAGRDREDIEHDLVARVCECHPKFDPARQTWHAFVQVVVTSAGLDLIKAQATINETARRQLTIPVDDLDAGTDENGEALSVADIIPDTGQSVADEVAFKIDLAERMASLPDKFKSVLARMMQGESHASIAEDMGLPKMEFSRKYATPIQQILAPDRYEEYREHSASA